MLRIATTGGSVLKDRKIYIVWLALIWATVVVGFFPDFPRFRSEAPSPPPILYLHGGIFLLWLVLVSLQVLWVELGNLRLHKQMGWLTVVVSALMVPITIVAALVDEARQVSHADYMPQFLGVEMEELIGFCGCMVAGVLWRRSPSAHKRLMILAAISISDAASARIFLYTFPVHFPGTVGFFAQFFWGNVVLIAAMIGWDLWRYRRIHPAVVFGGALILSGEIIATVLCFSPAWQQAMTRLVMAWGYGG